MYNIVSKKNIINNFKSSSHFKMNLGRSLSKSEDKKKRRFHINDKDKFTKFYFGKYRVALLSEGNIGSLNFFSDYYLNEDIIIVFHEETDFVFEFKMDDIKKFGGVDSYIGNIIKEIETKYKDELNLNGENSDEIADKKGDYEKLFQNPGAVSWEDIKDYHKRYKNQ